MLRHDAVGWFFIDNGCNLTRVKNFIDPSTPLGSKASSFEKRRKFRTASMFLYAAVGRRFLFLFVVSRRLHLLLAWPATKWPTFSLRRMGLKRVERGFQNVRSVLRHLQRAWPAAKRLTPDVFLDSDRGMSLPVRRVSPPPLAEYFFKIIFF